MRPKTKNISWGLEYNLNQDRDYKLQKMVKQVYKAPRFKGYLPL